MELICGFFSNFTLPFFIYFYLSGRRRSNDFFMVINLLETISYFNYSLFKTEYLILSIYLLIAIFLALLIIGASYFLVRQNPESEKLSAYEDARHDFDVKFCVVAILFIVFDIEIMFLIPWCVSVSNLDLLGFWSMIDFLFDPLETISYFNYSLLETECLILLVYLVTAILLALLILSGAYVLLILIELYVYYLLLKKLKKTLQNLKKYLKKNK